MKQKLLILRGAPASGKSSIARSLRDFEKKIAWIKVDNFKPFFADDASDALEYVNGAANAVTEYLLSQGFSVIMEGVFQNPSAIEDALEIAKQKNISAQAFELHCSLETLLERDKNRKEVKSGHRRIMDESIMKTIYKTISNNPCKSAEIFYTENITLKESVDIFQKHIL